jgi:nicotinate-nucleotide--dimethylbenzimidazole phosphoribosyltransferase
MEGLEEMGLEKVLKERLATIQPLKKEFFTQAQERLDQLTKPRGSLGQLEEIAKRYVAIVENVRPA